MRSRKTAIIASLSVSLLAIGCGPQDQLELPPDPVETERAIVNGKTYNGHPSVGRIVRQVGHSAASCTGTLIGKHTVLTAGHCVEPGGNHTFYVGGGSYKSNQVARHYQYSSTSTGGAQYDIALIKLSSDPPVTPSMIASKAPFKGQALTLIGYGITQTGLKDSGVKRIGYNKVDQITGTQFTYAGASGSTSNVCSGDSGGPAFTTVDGQEVHQGIHSMASRPCGSRGINARTDVFHAWIKQQSGGDVYEPAPDTTPPTVSIIEPVASAAVRQDFSVKVQAKDDQTLASVELFIGDKSVEKKPGQAEVVFWLSNVVVGPHTLKAVAMDAKGNKAEDQVMVTVVPPKGYGAQCNEHLDCKSVLCAAVPGRNLRFCTQVCDVNKNTCPSDANCLTVLGATMHLCSLPGGGTVIPGDDPDGSCSVAQASDPAGPAILALFALLFLLRRRR